MSKFSKGKKKKEPGISTAALPDIVFMLLFFFMVTTVFKEKETNKLEIDKVAIKETIDLEKNIKAVKIENPKNRIIDVYIILTPVSLIDVSTDFLIL